MSVGIRGRRVVAEYGPVLIALLLLGGMAGLASAGWIYTQPQIETTTTERFPQTISADVQSRAVVTGNTSLYDRGEVLRNKPIYLLNATPNVTLTVTTDVPRDAPTRVTQRLVLELAGTKDERVFWESDRVLINRTQRARSGQINTSVRINVPSLERELSAARSEVGQVGVFRTRLQLTVEYTTNRYNGTLTASAPLQIIDTAYWVDGELQTQTTRTTQVTQTTRSQAGPLEYLIPGIGGVLALAGAGVIWQQYRRLDLNVVETELSRRQYEEWISDGEFPSGDDKRHIRINSLEDLVDVAIDSNKRVIYDDTYQAYAVADGDLVYYFATNPDRVEAWLDI